MRSKAALSSSPQKKASIRKIVLFISVPLMLFVFFIASVAVIISIPGEVYTNIDDLADTISHLQPRVIALDGFLIKAQPDSFSCGITTVTNLSNYVNKTNYDVQDLIDKYASSKGSSSDEDMTGWLQGELPGRTISYKTNVTNAEMIRDIHASLKNNNPVVVCFGAPNPYNEPYYDFHASVVYGMNLDVETITIANSYGYSEEISLVEFLNRMSYTETNKYPFFQKISLKWFQDKNAYFLIK